jgi:hypothetical protein
LQSGSATEHHALENLRSIAGLAHSRRDSAVFIMANLLEGMAHLSAMKDDSIIRIQGCLAQASKLQLEESSQIPQIEVMTLLLSFACSLHQKAHHELPKKLMELQKRMDELKNSELWGTRNELLLPVRRPQNAPSMISDDTRAVLRQGPGDFDYLVLSTLCKQEVWATA